VDEKSRFRFSSAVSATALVVLFPELEALIGPWYRQHTEAGRRGLPPHVTLLYPFVDSTEYDEETAERIISTLAPFEPFGLSLAQTDRFRNGTGTLYLRPEPSRPFVAMIERIAAAFPGYAPYGGKFDEIIPHLTVARGATPLLDSIDRELASRLPVEVRVERVWFVVDTAGGWKRHTAFPML
jgi:2'-5' RNA ligase